MQQRQSTRDDYSRKINIVIEYINNNLTNDIDLDVLASVSNFSPYHFHRIFKAFTGEPIGAFITRMRVETAARLLRYSDMPVCEIAYKVGYDMPSSLSKVFKQFYDITPTEYRNNKKYTIMKPLKINSNMELSSDVINMEPQQAIYISLIGDYKKLDYCMAWKKLWNHVRMSGKFSEEMGNGKGIDSDKVHQMLADGRIAHAVIYHDDPKLTDCDKRRADICLVLPFKIEPKGEIGIKEIAGGRYVVYHYQGSYNQLDKVYDTIFGKYIPDGNYKLDERPLFEVYPNDPECTPPDKLLTEIHIPII